jgi:hypothetical protein
MSGRPSLPPALRPPVLLAIALMSGAAAPIPYPTAGDPPALAAWITANTRLKLEQVVVAGPDSVFAVEPSTAAPAIAGGRRIRLRQEVVRPTFAVVLGGRSAVLDLDIDCQGRRALRRSFDVYTAPNLTGAIDKLGADLRWTPADPGTALAAVVDATCDPLAPRPLDPDRPATEASTPAQAPAAASAGLRGAIPAPTP